MKPGARAPAGPARRPDTTTGTDREPVERPCTEHRVDRLGHRISAREYPGAEPAFVLMHGFPDNSHLYDLLVPELAGRRVVTFDFLGWGASDKPPHHPYTFADLLGDLDAVIDQLGLDRVVLVPHDASGPPAIDWALDHPERVAALGLLNCFYDAAPTTLHPEAIFVNTWWVTKPLVRAVERLSPRAVRVVHRAQVSTFFRDPRTRDRFVPLFTAQFTDSPSTVGPLLRLLDDHFPALADRTANLARLRAFRRPVRLVFGEHDPFCNPGVAADLHDLLLTSDYVNVPTAGHYVQLDEPAEVARLLLTIPEEAPPRAHVPGRYLNPLPTRVPGTARLLARYARRWGAVAACALRRAGRRGVAETRSRSSGDRAPRPNNPP